MDRWLYHLLALSGLIATPFLLFSDPVYARVLMITAVCLYVWIGELAPPFVPTLLLWSLIPILLSPVDPQYSMSATLGWAADPVMALFFGGFTLGAATEAYGIDKRLAAFALWSSGGSFNLFLFLVIMMTAFLSMWLSNIAAAALVLACLRPVLRRFRDDEILRRTLLVGVAFGADFGGIATPVGTGPNAIAIASLAPRFHISFVDWMIFAFPLTIGMLLLGFFILSVKVRSETHAWNPRDVDTAESMTPVTTGGKAFLLIMATTVVLWLTEPFHRIPAAAAALGAAAVIFLSGMLKKKDLIKLDWSTLMLIAGGITLGKLLERSGIVREMSAQIPFSGLNVTVGLFVLCLTAAMLSALMSNTATAVMLIPLAAVLIPAPSTVILVAIAASFGIPFVISTPPNAMATGQGGVRFYDLFGPGIVLMLIGCLVITLTGRAVLNLVGIP